MASRQGAIASSILVAVLVLLPVLPYTGWQASAFPAGHAGRAGPPLNGTDWCITSVEDVNYNINFAGNITVFANAQLRITNGVRLRIPTNSSMHHTIKLEPGGALQVDNRSTLEADRIIADSGCAFNVLRGGLVMANALAEIHGSCYIDNGSIIVTGSHGTSPGEAGNAARLLLDPGGTIRNSTLMVSGGNGANATSGTGAPGGAGGNATLVMKSKEFFNVRVSMKSGDGGAGGGMGVNGGPGGNGGKLELNISGDILSNTTMTCLAGDGGDGGPGASPGSGDGGNGGYGGNGGAADIRWNGRSINISSSNLSIASGKGGRGGDGGVAQRNGNGGSGGEGGTGGSINAAIEAKGTFSMTGSRLDLRAGPGSFGGNFGRAMVPGNIDGRPGDGGAGGSAACEIKMADSSQSNNSSFAVASGDGGTGGAGSSAARGGTGGTARLAFNIAALNPEPTFSSANCSIVSRGGSGGDGGKGQGTGQTPGQPGDGSNGGGARIEVVSANDLKSVDFDHVEVSCDPGKGGLAVNPAKPGNPGVGEIFIMTRYLHAGNSTFNNSMGPVNGNDYWRFDNCDVPEYEPFNISEAGIAELWYSLKCYVKDVDGVLIEDGSVTVELTRSGDTSTCNVKRTDSLGKAEFQKMGARFVANPEETERTITYIAQALSDSGDHSKPLNIPLGADVMVDLFLILKLYPPEVTIESPDHRLTPILYASNWLRTNGTTEPFPIEGTAADSVLNTEQSISLVEFRIGDGPWLLANLTMPIFNSYRWYYSWDIYNWAQGQLTSYPLGIIPATITARSYNDRFYSNEARQNITVYLLRIPPPPPDIEIVRPVHSSPLEVGSDVLPVETPITFEARVVRSYGTRVILWRWFVDYGSGFVEVWSSSDCSTVNITFPIDTVGSTITIEVRAYDNESARRVEILRGGVSYYDFNYYFNQDDGSNSCKLRAHIIHRDSGDDQEPPPPPGLCIGLLFLVIIIAIALAIIIARSGPRGKGG